jgi:hypothetical protein
MSQKSSKKEMNCVKLLLVTCVLYYNFCEGVYFLKAAPKFVFWFTFDKMNISALGMTDCCVPGEPA